MVELSRDRDEVIDGSTSVAVKRKRTINHSLVHSSTFHTIFVIDTHLHAKKRYSLILNQSQITSLQVQHGQSTILNSFGPRSQVESTGNDGGDRGSGVTVRVGGSHEIDLNREEASVHRLYTRIRKKERTMELTQ